ncbi:MAG: glycosyltransferase [Methylobacteriaceae bacterium]|nr:glycosyltransferase [Methylobacteriaceae bacterium]
MSAAIQTAPSLRLVPMDETAAGTRPEPALRPRLVEAAGRHLLMFLPARDAALHLAINGEPTVPTRLTRLDESGLPGLNLLHDPAMDGETPPFGLADPQAGRIGRDIAEQWTLEAGHTAYLAAAGAAELVAIYRDASGRDATPVLAGRRYEASGLFGLHRCEGLICLDALREDGCVLARAETRIEKRLGGRAAADYAAASVQMTVPADAQSLRLSLVLQPLRGQAGAHLFFTRLTLGMPGAAASRMTCLRPEEALAVACGAGELVELVLPARSIVEAAEVAVALPDGRPIDGLPLRLPAAQLAPFVLGAFDGATLTGRLPQAEGAVRLRLLVDDRAVAAAAVAPDPEGGAEVSLRVPDAWLDGAPHVVSLVEERSGATLFAAAEILPAARLASDARDGAGRPLAEPEEDPLASRRAPGLLAHLERLAAGEDGADAALAIRCQAILSGRERSGEEPPLPLPSPAEPRFTILLHGARNAESVRRSAAGLLFSSPSADFEVSLVGPEPDGLAELVSGLGRTDDGPGWLARAGAMARARRVVLLRAGCEPLPGWLDALDAAFTTFDGLGAAGAAVLTREGRLAEAGRIVRASGTVEPLAWGGNPRDPRADHVRLVDQLGAEAVMIDREALATAAALVGEGPDGPAESTEAALAALAFALGRLGRALVVVPDAAVARPWPDLADQAGGHALAPPRLDTATRRRWRAELATLTPDEAPLALALDRGADGCALVIDLQLPRPDMDAGSYAADQEIRLLQALGYKVTVAPLDAAGGGRYAAALRRRGVEILHAPFAPSLEAALAGRPDGFDLVYMTRYNVARIALPLLRRYLPRAKRVFNVADLHFLRELRAGLAGNDPKLVARSRVTREAELALMREVDLTLTYSEVEAAIIESHHLGRAKVALCPWVAEAPPSVPPREGRRGIAFLGSYGHRPNEEAMVRFCRDVMPLLRARLPDLTLSIWGSQVTPDVEALAGPGVTVRGHAPNLGEVYGSARVFVAPLISGAGIKGKVIGAMAQGCPTVLSPIAAEGIAGRAGLDYRLAESPGAWVEAVAALVEDDALWDRTAASARALVAERYGFERGLGSLRRALETIDIFPPERPGALVGRPDR